MALDVIIMAVVGRVAQLLLMTNLVVQGFLITVVLFAVYLVKKKKDLTRHCAIVRGAVLLQLLAIAVVMFPSMTGYLEHEDRGTFFNTVMLIHHSLGLAVVVLWLYLNLVLGLGFKLLGRLVVWMRLALSLWITAFLLGLFLYVLISTNQ